MRELYLENLKNIITFDLALDIPKSDITTDLIENDTIVSASLMAKEDLVLCGVDALLMIFSNAKLEYKHTDGDNIKNQEIFYKITGSAKEILRLERTALNLLQTMSGTATLSREVSSWVEGFSTKILDTRKTLPGLRYIQKYAVAVGGNTNHRLNLSDDYLIKDNHIKFASLPYLLDRYELIGKNTFLVVEVETLEQFEYVASRKIANRIMLDNFSLQEMRLAIAMNTYAVPLEVSGIPFDKETIISVASLGVDYISIGALTKNLKSVDISMEF